MYCKPKLAIKHQVEDLINLIEKNDFENFKKVIEECPKLIKKTKMDEYEPIVYAIRYGHFKIFKFLIEKMKEYSMEIEVSKISTLLFKQKNKKIFRYFMESLCVNLNHFLQQVNFLTYSDKFHNSSLPQLVMHHRDILEVMLNEVNFSYKVVIDSSLYNLMGYNYPYQEGSSTGGVEIYFINVIY